MRPTGKLDVPTAPALRGLLRGNDAAPAVHLIADLAGVTFIGNSALTKLETAPSRSEAAGGRLRLAYHQHTTGRLLRLTSLVRRFPALPLGLALP
ncbi:STAS domain-containing protein [Streptomyces sp. NPDC017529]|uniref:STAS domain-containing protein n=1 Tax=Streptomyces sp. NPDC017529 TaxID=3365000 RepID=UPI0037B69988